MTVTKIHPIAFAIVFRVATAAAQTPSEFEQAAGSSGCGLIPYSSQRSTCESKGAYVEEYCKRKTWSCDGLDPDGLKRNIESVKRKIEDLRRERDNLQSKRSSSNDDGEKRDLENKIADIEKELRRFEDMAKDWEQKLEDEKKEIAARLYVGRWCRDYRLEVQKVFIEAKSKLKSESDAEIKPHAQRIVEKIEAEEPG
ncbi:MAG: hypothetical protein ACTHU0_19670, partial [Kofleriaceae bacterium]